MLEPEIQKLIETIKEANIDYRKMPITEARELRHALARKQPRLANPPATKIDDQTVALSGRNIRLRIYKPLSLSEQVLPVIFYFHGGGFVWGMVESYDDVCSILADATRSAVISVDYRYAPEFPFPAAFNDCYESMAYVLQRAKEFSIDSSNIAVAGDSAGGAIAAAVCLRTQDEQGPEIRAQLLIYPWVDCNFETVSYKEMGRDYILTTEMMKWYANQYLPNIEDRKNLLAMPLHAKDFANLPPALVVTAKYDPLCSEGEDYAKRLQEAGNQMQLICYETMNHGFITHAGFCPAAHRAVIEISNKFAQFN